jgi:hypothetical protein
VKPGGPPPGAPAPAPVDVAGRTSAGIELHKYDADAEKGSARVIHQTSCAHGLPDMCRLGIGRYNKVGSWDGTIRLFRSLLSIPVPVRSIDNPRLPLSVA